ncbi:MAG TPA: hypothetical protein H9716_00995 [Candidatus Enterocloster faecavium]|uniref:Uncharacterized protein n=1 Tax=Candidatus Enterocloster faecavium TaxID=2838560 RepID=A0A9D2RJK9_9FIRM|nr:hypothetical protein [Candidatus Enterocloster faecavium]
MAEKSGLPKEVIALKTLDFSGDFFYAIRGDWQGIERNFPKANARSAWLGLKTRRVPIWIKRDL